MSRFNNTVSFAALRQSLVGVINDAGENGEVDVSAKEAPLKVWHKANAKGLTLDQATDAALAEFWPDDEDDEDNEDNAETSGIASEQPAETVPVGKATADMSRRELLRYVSDHLPSEYVAEMENNLRRAQENARTLAKSAMLLEDAFGDAWGSLPIAGTHSHDVKGKPTGINNPDFVQTTAVQQAQGYGKEFSFYYGVADATPAGAKAVTDLNDFLAHKPGAAKDTDLKPQLDALRQAVNAIRSHVRKAVAVVQQKRRLAEFPHFEVSFIRDKMGGLVNSPTNVKVYCGGYKVGAETMHYTRVISTSSLLMLDLDLMAKRGGDLEAFQTLFRREKEEEAAKTGWKQITGAKVFADGLAHLNTWASEAVEGGKNNVKMLAVIEALESDKTGTCIRAAQDIRFLLETALASMSAKARDKATA